MHNELKTIIEQAWENRALLQNPAVQQAVRQVVELVDKGELRTAEPVDPAKSEWKVNEWVKKAVILYFPIQPMRKMEAGELEWYDKMELKHGYGELGVRVVPQAVARYGAYIAPGAILMPSYVNIGAYVDTGTMVDTWATVGSCAQIGKHVHLSGGVGIGGVLEPVQAAPVIIEDSCFIGSRCIVVEGAHVCREAVLGSNTVITGSTHIIDVTGPEPVTYKAEVYKALGGFSKMRFGEDIDFSIRIFQGGYACRLFPEAWVWHKRRTDLKKFFKQVHNSGIARINLYKKYPKSLKVVHLLPALFTIGIVFLLLYSLVCSWSLSLLLLFALIICVDSTLRNKSFKIGLLSILASFIQLIGYGTGFLRAWWKRCVLGKNEFAAFEKNFYK